MIGCFSCFSILNALVNGSNLIPLIDSRYASCQKVRKRTKASDQLFGVSKSSIHHDEPPRFSTPLKTKEELDALSPPTFQQQVRESMRLRKGVLVRTVTSLLNRWGVKCTPTTVRRTVLRVRMNWFKTRKGQQLTDSNKTRRVHCAQQLRQKLGIDAQTWSGRGGAQTYSTSELYAKFISVKTVPAIESRFENNNLQPICQHDQDRKQRTSVAFNTVNFFFEGRVSPEDGDARFTDD